MKSEIHCAVIGSGKIALDLLVKLKKSPYLKPILVAGQRKESEGLAFAHKLGVPTSDKSIEAILKTDARIIFDCTTASSHLKHAPLLKDRFLIDLTPAKVLPICVPTIKSASQIKGKGVNLGTCTVQAVLPKLIGIKHLSYVEVVTTIASDSAGMGTRENISEYLETTAKIIKDFTGARAKAILIINPTIQAMHNTIYYQTKGLDKVKIIQFEMQGKGDYLDKRFGNLDTMTISAILVAENYAKNYNLRLNA